MCTCEVVQQGTHAWNAFAQACDLDPEMEGLARRMFAFKATGRTRLVASEGMQLIRAMNAALAPPSELGQRLPLPPTLPIDSPSRIPQTPSNSTAITAIGSSIKAGQGTAEGTNLADPLAVSAVDLLTIPLTGLISRMDFIFIDVDSKDPSLAMSAPPPNFITPVALRAMHDLLRPGGMLALNVRQIICSAPLAVILMGNFSESKLIIKFLHAL